MSSNELDELKQNSKNSEDSKEIQRNLCSKTTDYICFAVTCIFCACVVMIGFYIIRTHKGTELAKSTKPKNLTDLTEGTFFETLILENQTVITVRFRTIIW